MAAAAPGGKRILIGLALGAAAGVAVNALAAGNTQAQDAVRAAVRYVTKPVGDVFINLLFLAIIPLVFASLAVGVTKLGGGASAGRVGLKTIAYFVLTTACAAAIGLAGVNLLRPGDRLPPEQKEQLMEHFGKEAGEKTKEPPKFGVETFVNIVPKNALEAAVKKDMLAIIFTALLVGVALTRIDPDKAKVLIDVLDAVNAVTDFVIHTAMRLAPYAVFCLIFSTTALFGYELLVALGAFVATVLIGLAVQLLVVFPLLVYFLGGMSPVEFFRRSRGTMITAFSTSSSSATLPTAIACAEEELGVPPAVARFVLPLSASMNHNGTALFEGVVVMFLAQAFGVSLSLADQLLVLLLCVLTATGMAGVPGGSLPLIGLILAQFGIPASAIAVVLGVDRILDMCRTMVNVTGDLTTVVYVAGSEREAGGEAVTLGERGA